jgi:hypothetical protein
MSQIKKRLPVASSMPFISERTSLIREKIKVASDVRIVGGPSQADSV